MRASASLRRFTHRPRSLQLHLRLTLSLLAASAMALSAQQPVFRTAVDLVAVDVQVVDNAGTPVGSIGPEAFQVSIEGRRRRVVSAQFVRHGAAPVRETTAASTGSSPLDSPEPAQSSGRTLIVAVDSGSFDIGSAQPSMDALRAMVDRLEPGDRLGLYVYPTTVWIPPSVDRARVRIALGSVIGEKQPIRSRYNLRPWEIVDISAQWTNPNSFLTTSRNLGRGGIDSISSTEMDPVLNVQRRECPAEADCAVRIYAEGVQLAIQLERDVHNSLSGLEALLRGLASMPGRKSVVLVSAGMLVSDRLDGRPDAGNMARIMGQTAAQANAIVYTVHVDTNFSGNGSASKRAPGNADGGRERALFANWLDEFSDAAGGARFHAPVGDAAFAFDRVLRESSGYYLLGVEPADADRDGKPRRLQVKVDRRKVTVRSRQWVVIPQKRSA